MSVFFSAENESSTVDLWSTVEKFSYSRRAFGGSGGPSRSRLVQHRMAAPPGVGWVPPGVFSKKQRDAERYHTINRREGIMSYVFQYVYLVYFAPSVDVYYNVIL